MVTVLGTQLCCRVGELKRLKICNFLPGFDATFHPKYHCSAVFRLRKRKQAQLRRGLYPQVLPRSRPELCTVQRLKACCRPEGSGSRQTKGAHQATKCRHCPALFTSEWRMVFNSSYPSRSRTRSSSQLIRVDSPLVLGTSMRRGGHLGGGARTGARAGAASTERTLIGNGCACLHGAAGPASSVRDGAGAAPLSTVDVSWQ